MSDNTDKIKVWKCNKCTSNKKGCLFFDLDEAKSVKPIDAFPECDGFDTDWQPTTDYKITERNPESLLKKEGKKLNKPVCEMLSDQYEYFMNELDKIKHKPTQIDASVMNPGLLKASDFAKAMQETMKLATVSDEPQKFRLKLPENIGLISSQWEFLKKIDGKIVKVGERLHNSYCLISQWSYDHPIFKVKKDWLVVIPIKPELSEAEKWLNAYCGYALRPDFAKQDIFTYDNMIDSNEAGQKLSTKKLTGSLKSFIDDPCISQKGIKDWQQHFKMILSDLGIS